MPRSRRLHSRGFTLLEMMAVLAIISVLAAIALPSYSRHIKRTRASEAVVNLERMWQSAVAYFNTEHATAEGQILPMQFPSSAPATPARAPIGVKYDVRTSDWTHPSWDALNFAMSQPHYYQYGFFNRSDPDAPPGGGGPAFDTDGPFASPGGPLGTGPFGGGDGKPGLRDKDDERAPKGTKAPRARVTVCHVPPGNPEAAHSITIAEPALLEAHLEHGDVIGPCPGDEPEGEEAEGGETEADGEDPDDPAADAEPEGPFDSSPGGTNPCAHLFVDGQPDPGMYVTATGNLDGDDDYGYFYRGGVVTPDCRIVGPPAVLNENELE